MIWGEKLGAALGVSFGPPGPSCRGALGGRQWPGRLQTPGSVGLFPVARSEDSFVVQDYAQVDHIQVQKVEACEPSLPGGGSRGSYVPHPFQVTLLHNSEGRQEKILLSSDSA